MFSESPPLTQSVYICNMNKIEQYRKGCGSKMF